MVSSGRNKILPPCWGSWGQVRRARQAEAWWLAVRRRWCPRCQRGPGWAGPWLRPGRRRDGGYVRQALHGVGAQARKLALVAKPTPKAAKPANKPSRKRHAA